MTNERGTSRPFSEGTDSKADRIRTVFPHVFLLQPRAIGQRASCQYSDRRGAYQSRRFWQVADIEPKKAKIRCCGKSGTEMKGDEDERWSKAKTVKRGTSGLWLAWILFRLCGCRWDAKSPRRKLDDRATVSVLFIAAPDHGWACSYNGLAHMIFTSWGSSTSLF